MAKRRVRTPRPKRTEHPLVKAAHLQERLDIILDRLVRAARDLAKVRQQIAYQSKQAETRKRKEGTP
jgi:hypothetical protein